jgi:hypothetical protein
MPTNLPAQINAIVNVVLGIMLSVWALKCAKHSLTPFSRYIRYMYVLVGLCWSGFYIATFFGAFNSLDTIHLGQAIFRPMVTVTLATLAVDHIWKKKMNGGCR